MGEKFKHLTNYDQGYRLHLVTIKVCFFLQSQFLFKPISIKCFFNISGKEKLRPQGGLEEGAEQED